MRSMTFRYPLLGCACFMVMIPYLRADRIKASISDHTHRTSLKLPWLCDTRRCQAKTEDGTNILLLEKTQNGCLVSEVGDVKGSSPKPTVVAGVHLRADVLMEEAHRKCEEQGLMNQYLIDASHLPCGSMDKRALVALGTKGYQQLRTIVHRMYYTTPLYMKYGYVPCEVGGLGRKRLWPGLASKNRDTSGATMREPFCESLTYLRSVTVAAVRLEARRPDCYFLYAGNGLDLLDSMPALEDVPCEEESLLGECFLQQRKAGGCEAQALVQAKLMFIQAMNAARYDFMKPTKSFFDEAGQPNKAAYDKDPEPFVDFSVSIDQVKQACPIAYHGGRILSVSQFCRSDSTENAKATEFCSGS